MNLADPKDITVKIVLLIPIILTLFSSYMIDKTDGNIIAGFNTMEEDKKENPYVKLEEQHLWCVPRTLWQ